MKYKPLILLLLVIFLAGDASTQTVTLKQVGKSGVLHRKYGGVNFNGALYSFSYGALYKTDLSSGIQTRLGNTIFTNNKFFFTINNKLYTIETDGSMNEIDPVTGAWSIVSSIGTWASVTQIIVVDNSFYSFENGAFFYHSELDPVKRKQVGESEFYNIGKLYRGDSALYSLLYDGNLHEINITTGGWKRIGETKAWKFVKMGVVVNDKFYTIETPDGMFETTLSDGTKKQLDATRLKKIWSWYLFEASGKLYTVNSYGTLYEVRVN